MTGIDKTLVGLCGVGFIALGLGILASGGMTLPSKAPPLRFHFAGLSLLLLGSSPLTLGVMCLALTTGRLKRKSNRTTLMFGASMAMVGTAFLIAPKF